MTEREKPEARAQKRERIILPISYGYSSEEQGRTGSVVRSGITLDMSESGVCIYTAVDFAEGTILDMHGRTAYFGARKGSVRWCKMITEDLFRVGVQLLN
jgi:hypothetical protein